MKNRDKNNKCPLWDCSAHWNIDILIFGSLLSKLILDRKVSLQNQCIAMCTVGSHWNQWPFFDICSDICLIVYLIGSPGSARGLTAFFDLRSCKVQSWSWPIFWELWRRFSLLVSSSFLLTSLVCLPSTNIRNSGWVLNSFEVHHQTTWA